LAAPQPTRLLAGSLQINPEGHEVYVAGKRLPVTAKEFALLAALTASPGRLLRRQELVTSLWGREDAVQSRTIDVHVARLRRKLTDAGLTRSPIKTVHGLGYRWLVRNPSDERKRATPTDR